MPTQIQRNTVERMEIEPESDVPEPPAGVVAPSEQPALLYRRGHALLPTAHRYLEQPHAACRGWDAPKHAEPHHRMKDHVKKKRGKPFLLHGYGVG